MAFPVTLPQAREMVIDCFKARLMPMVTGSPGNGKSAMIQAVAKDFGLKVIDLRLATCDPTDLLGFPDVDRDAKRAGYRPMETFPLEGDPVPEGYAGFLLFLDELNSADKDVQKAAYKLIYDRKVGEFNLHEKCLIAGAGNLDTDNAIVEELSTALQSRMVHIEVQIDNASWLEWAAGNGIDHRILSYLRFRPDNLFAFNPDHDDKTFACPRTWEFASRLIRNKDKFSHTDRALLAGTVSEGVGREFAGFCEIYQDLPTLDAIMARPDQVPISEEPSIQFALTGILATHATERTIDRLMPFIERLPIEMQVVTLRDILRRNPAMEQTPPIEQWILTKSEHLF